MDKGKIICFGEMMLRLNCPGYRRFTEASGLEMLYGGSEANVAILLARLGMDVEYVTRLPANDLADAAVQALTSQGVKTSFLLRGGERMGLYFSETGNSVRATRIIYDRSHSGFSTVMPGMVPWKKIFGGASWFHWSGISPAVSASAAEVCMEALQEARANGIRISADFNHRNTLWKYGQKPGDVMPGLLEHCEVVTGDLDSASVYFDIPVAGKIPLKEAVVHCGKALQQKLPAMRTLGMSFREMLADGSLAYCGMLMCGEEIDFHGPYRIHQPVGRIGSGDAFMGGLLYGVMQELSNRETIAFATAAGALKHSIVSDIPLFSAKEVLALIQDGPGTGKVFR